MTSFEIPDTPASTAALEVATEYLSPALLSHSQRVYWWAVGYAERDGLGYDAELLFVAAMFHDVALMPEFDSHTVAFGKAGGHVARVFGAGAGWSRERRDRLSEAIVQHMWPTVDPATDPEGHLLSRAAALDIVGKDPDGLSPSLRTDVLRTFPRLGLDAEFLACFQAQAERKPASSAANAIRTGLADRIGAAVHAH
ncbi:HD domain-containing protein [Kribbella jejuensis]|uniref:HD domain-containing protein n=1 Tax=Kribbella jejuensis TaxID=236068 RepID=A0A542DSW9_9ACTN|nr:HD domain-containing protein [Kribbella jejuensis]TQJ06148.1 HD domain-containing protein [Kribbella jejuensis]